MQGLQKNLDLKHLVVDMVVVTVDSVAIGDTVEDIIVTGMFVVKI